MIFLWEKKFKFCANVFFHVLLVQHGCSENTPYDFFKRKLSLVGGDNQGHLHENIAPGAGTFTYFLQPISPSPRLCPGWGGGGAGIYIDWCITS